MLLSKCRLSNNRLDNFLLSKQTLGNFYLDGPIYGSDGQLIDHSTPVTVANYAYDTSGNGGRRLVKLSNGWLVCAMYAGDNQYKLYKSEDNGYTWSELALSPSSNSGSETYDISITHISGTVIAVLYTFSTGASRDIRCYRYDVLAGTSTIKIVDTSQTAIGRGSIITDPFGNLHAAWASKNATYPNSFNIRYSKSTDGGATWATPTQVISQNTSGVDVKNPCIVVNSAGNPVILYTYNASANTVYSSIYDGSTWTNYKIIYAGSSYAQSNPCAVVDGTGQINATWQGHSSTHATTYHIFFSKSTNNGVNWATAIDVAVGEKPSITHDKDNNVYIQYERSGVIYQKKSTDQGATWGTETTIATGTNVNACNNYDNFTQPLNIFDGGADVKFSGVFYV